MANNIEGLDRLLARLDKIAGDNAVMKGIEKGCLRVEATAKENASEFADTGLLMASINHKLFPEGLYGTVGTNVEYASAQEFGTVNMRAQPSLYPALESNIDKIKQDIIEAVKAEIRGE